MPLAICFSALAFCSRVSRVVDFGCSVSLSFTPSIPSDVSEGMKGVSASKGRGIAAADGDLSSKGGEMLRLISTPCVVRAVLRTMFSQMHERCSSPSWGRILVMSEPKRACSNATEVRPWE